MEYNQLKYFQAVARLENISQAARELYVTQPNLSRSIARLEKELGMPLFEHKKGKIELNDYGRIFLSSVNESFSDLDKGIQTIRRLHEANQNFLLLGSSINDFLPDVLKDFSVLHSDIGIRQIECSLEDLGQHILNGSIEIAITSQQIDENQFTFELIEEHEFVIMVGTDHPLKGRKVVSMEDLKKERFICDHSRMDAEMLNRICMDEGFEPVIAFDLENTKLIYNLLLANAGISFMPITQIAKVNREYPDSGIQVIRLKENLPKAQLGIIYRKDYVFSNAAMVLRNYLKEWVQREHGEIDNLVRE